MIRPAAFAAIRRRAGLLVAVISSLGAAGPSATAPPADWPIAAQATANELLGSVIDLDAQVRFVLHAGEHALTVPFAQHRINRALDPYSLALHQEGRDRRDPLARLMREATLSAARHETTLVRARSALAATERLWQRERIRLIDAITRLRALARQLESGKPPSRARARQLAARTVAEIDKILVRIATLGERVGEIVRQAELSWSRVREPAQRAMPAAGESREPTERFAETMIGEVLAIEYDLRRASRAVKTGSYRLEQEVARIRGLLDPVAGGP